MVELQAAAAVFDERRLTTWRAAIEAATARALPDMFGVTVVAENLDDLLDKLLNAVASFADDGGIADL
ncbi:hypothetical protein ACFQFC_02780 [Amorphoplanes digitatis]|uniref:Uncharacterized protein n=1 Tax=Actinoplanes digitatis TaxID=1868 RepID=A0A7W7MQV2_9ACTN|nr:hypothetical protein [Actinoplanes digitatis]MBB4763102.1 hypothetical protein [Actinoplanes digitatis]GID97177.1 hypothetical protein Adi01nite_65890 [Actinoplanes digitatis]